MRFWQKIKAYVAACEAHRLEQAAGFKETKEQLAGFEKSLARFAREQAKANMLWEQNQAAQNQLVHTLQKTVQENRAAYEQLSKIAEERGRMEASQKLLPEMLAFLDELYQAVLAMEQQALKQELFKEWTEGIHRLHQRGEEILAFWNITAIPAKGQPFDPAVHRAIEVVSSTAVTVPLVIGELQRGYRQGEVLLRPADVVVVKPVTADAAPATEEGDHVEPAGATAGTTPEGTDGAGVIK